MCSYRSGDSPFLGLAGTAGVTCGLWASLGLFPRVWRSTTFQPQWHLLRIWVNIGFSKWMCGPECDGCTTGSENLQNGLIPQNNYCKPRVRLNPNGSSQSVLSTAAVIHRGHERRNGKKVWWVICSSTPGWTEVAPGKPVTPSWHQAPSDGATVVHIVQTVLLSIIFY